MFENCLIEMRAVRSILKDGLVDKGTYVSLIEAYDEDQEYFLLNTDMPEVNNYSLDNVYECRISGGEEDLYCYGMVKERYWNRRGGIIRFAVQNGFYRSL